MLEITEIELELLSDTDKYLFINNAKDYKKNCLADRALFPRKYLTKIFDAIHEIKVDEMK